MILKGPLPAGKGWEKRPRWSGLFKAEPVAVGAAAGS
jgi:hypothetical protein